MLGPHADWGGLASLLFLLQFPAYALILGVVVPRVSDIWKIGIVLMLIALHVSAVLAAVQVP
jgi:hypothetical protein